MNSRIITQNELDVLFYEEFTQFQLQHVFNIIFLLSQYMLLTTDMLIYLYEKQYNEKMGLSYLKRSVKEKLIIEYQYDLNEATEKKIFYYALKSSTFLYLKQNRISFAKIPPYCAYEEKSRILTFNKYAIQKGYTLNINMPLDSEIRYFVTNQNVICYFPNYITEGVIQNELRKKRIEIEFGFEVISIPRVEVGKYTRAINPKDVD